MENKEEEKDLVIKLGPEFRKKAEYVREAANRGDEFEKQLNFKEVFEYLLMEYGEKSIPELYGLREQPSDRLKALYRKSGEGKSYEDWLIELAEKGAGVKRKVKTKKIQVPKVGVGGLDAK